MISVTPAPFTGSIGLLGVHPTLETLLPQGVLVVIAVLSYLHYTRKAAASAAA